jgi:DNA-binding transcriptional LysR family regulator
VFDLNQLRCFVAVAEELHFGRAARRLNMTQPPLSRHIQVLERILDVTLLERTSRSVRLTSTGRSFLPEAQRLLRMAEAAAQLAKRVESGTAGSLKIAFTAASSYSFVPTLVAAAMTALPDVHLSLSEMVTRDQVEALLSGQADLGLMRPPIARAELDSLRVVSEPLLAAIPLAHPLAQADAVALSDLDGLPFVMYTAFDARYFHDALVALFASAKVLPRYVQHLSQIHSILALVKAGLGCAIVPASAANLHYDGVALKPLRLSTPVAVELFMVWRRDHDNPMIDRLLALVRETSPDS